MKKGSKARERGLEGGAARETPLSSEFNPQSSFVLDKLSPETKDRPHHRQMGIEGGRKEMGGTAFKAR